MNKLLKYYLLAMAVFFAWIIGGIMAIPMTYRQFDDDLRVSTLQQGKITEPGDIQPAGDAGLLWTTTDPQKQ